MNKKAVICAIDVNDYDQEVVDLAASFAVQFGVDLHLVHVTLFPDPNNAAWPAFLGSPDALVQDSHRLRDITTKLPEVEIHRHHLSGKPSRQVLEFVEHNEPQLLVLGTHGRRGAARLFGSAASNILRHASCPVMVMRQRENSQEFSDLKIKTT